MITYIDTLEERAREILTECGELAQSSERIFTEDLRLIIKELQAIVDTPKVGNTFVFWGYYTPKSEFPRAVFLQGERLFFRGDDGELQQITDKNILKQVIKNGRKSL